MVLFGIFKKKKKGNQTPNNKETPATNPTETGHKDTKYVPLEPTHQTASNKHISENIEKKNITTTDLPSNHQQSTQQKATKSKQSQIKQEDPNVFG